MHETLTGASETVSRGRPGLRDTLDLFHRFLRGEIPLHEAARRLGTEESRLRVYREFVEGHARDVLEKNFQVLFETLPTESRAELVRRHFKQSPPSSWELNRVGATLPGFVARLAEDGELGLTEFHADIAKLEWAEFLVFASEADVPQPGELSRPIPNPTLLALELRYPASTFIRDQRRAGGSRGDRVPRIPVPAPETVLVYRDPETHLAVFRRATPDLLFALKMAAEGVKPAHAARLCGVTEATAKHALEHARRAGVVVG